MTATYVCGTGCAVRVVNYGLVYEFEGSFELSFCYVSEQGYCFFLFIMLLMLYCLIKSYCAISGNMIIW